MMQGLIFSKAIPTLRAEESMAMATAFSVASGNMKPEASREIFKGWKRDLEVFSAPVKKKKAPLPKNKDEIVARLSELPIAIREVSNDR